MSAQLSPVCINILMALGLKTDPSESGDLAVFDPDGDRWFYVTPGINERDLQSMLRIFSDRFEAGYDEGRACAFEDLRRLIGAADGDGSAG